MADDRPIMDSNTSPRSLGFSEQLDPQAEPVSTYVRPATPAPSSLHGLASSLANFSQDLGGFLKQRQAKQDDRDKALAEAAAYKANGTGYADAVKQGLIPSYNSPIFVQAYKNAQGSILGKRLASGAVDAYQTWDGRNSQNPGDMDNFIGNYIKGHLTSDDPDVLAGALPYVHSASDALYNANQKDRSDQLYQSGVATHIASSSMNIDNAQDVSLTKGSTPDYDGLWHGLMADRQAALNSGIRADDYDKSMVEMIHSKALEYMDPAMLGLLKNKVPGQTYSYDDMDGSKATQDTLSTMEARQASVEAHQAALQAKQDKQSLEALSGQVIGQLAAHPDQPVDPALIAQGVKYGDGAFAVHVREWQNTLSKPQPEDPAAIMHLQQQVLNGGGLGVITDNLGPTGAIHSPETLTKLYTLANAVSAQDVKAVTDNLTVKRIMGYLLQAFPAKDDMGSIIAGGTSIDAIQAQTDFTLAMARWYREHPNAAYHEIAAQATKVLQDLRPSINDEQPTDSRYVRPVAITRDMQGSGDVQPTPAALTPDAETLPLEQAAEAARTAGQDDTSTNPWAGEHPPTLDALPADQQRKINERAAALGVDPQTVISLMYPRMRPRPTPPTEPMPPAIGGAEAGDYLATSGRSQ